MREWEAQSQLKIVGCLRQGAPRVSAVIHDSPMRPTQPVTIGNAQEILKIGWIATGSRRVGVKQSVQLVVRQKEPQSMDSLPDRISQFRVRTWVGGATYKPKQSPMQRGRTLIEPCRTAPIISMPLSYLVCLLFEMFESCFAATWRSKVETAMLLYIFKLQAGSLAHPSFCFRSI